ncbi:hypothetical protein [Burkholderia ubonensis]|uniref:hypothetical protein n=1 Tax=Burkholderia ubonensis TaxID=101571 RepID=UPI00075614D5|nr:hypothetical protein [Burkholderia ubonensis]KVC84004.1 hypothetical protein WI75_04860 [Burkholderia ubonensis]
MAEIDKDKMRALVVTLRLSYSEDLADEAADAILALCDRLEAAEKERDELVHDNEQLVKAASAEATLVEELRAELESFKQAVLDPENQPSQYGTVLLESAAADKRRLSLELTGVIIDVEHGHGFDDVCLATIKRVEAALAQRQGDHK